MKKYIMPVLFLIFMLSLAMAGADDTDHFAKLGVTRIDPREADDFKLRSLDGKTVRLSDMRGKVVLLNFWATWCGPCVMEVNDIDLLHDTLGGEDFAVMAVSVGEDGKKVSRFMERAGIDFPVYLDTDTSVARKYQVRGIPTTYIVDPKGFLVGSVVGPREWGGDDSIALMRSLMD